MHSFGFSDDLAGELLIPLLLGSDGNVLVV